MNPKIKTAILTILLLITSGKLFSISPEELLKIDLDKSYKSYKINELRLIRSMVYAKHGYLFPESDLRNYFIMNFKWYETMVYKNAELEWEGKKVPPIVLSEKEQKFVTDIDQLIQEKCRKNFQIKDSLLLPELDNIANRFGDTDFSNEFKNNLKENGFVIKKDSLEQLFHLYDQNLYENIPNFVTSDLFLQLFHSYFSYCLQSIEKEKLSKLVSDLTLVLYKESLKYTGSKDEQIVKMANFNACYFAVAYTLISGNKLNVPGSIVGNYANELVKIEKKQDYFSLLFKSPVPYSLFIPRGYYSRTEEQRRYFKTMIWLQIAPFCLSDNELLKDACFTAFLLRDTKDALNRPLKVTYDAIYEPIAFLLGDADNISIIDICDIYDKYKIYNVNWLSDPKIINIVITKLKEVEKQKDQIQPKIKLSCYPKINFMPQRYVVDNDILQQFVDITVNAEKALPKGLEVFSVLGVNPAKEILYNHYQENKKWNLYDSVMQQQTKKFKNFNDWDKTIYNKWLQCLIKLNKSDKNYPYFMQNSAWQLKSLNTSLASWSQQKHDVILYAEQPMAAEMGDGGEELPPPVTVGYVEPNLQFWSACKELLSKNELFLTKYSLKTKDLDDKTTKVKNILDFLILVSKKELNHQPLNNDDYGRIERLGGEIDYLSLNMLSAYVNYNYWEEVKGPDKTVALVADIYTRGIPGCSKNGILHEGTGLGNDIYVLVEINGLLYLTSGAVFSYYEFPFQERLTDERWLEMLQQKNAPNTADWMNKMIVSQ